MKIRSWIVVLTICFSPFVFAKELPELRALLQKTTQTDLDYAATFVHPTTGEIYFGNQTKAMRGGEVDQQFSPADMKDEFWTHPDTKFKLASSPRRPIKAWHSGFISSFARASQNATDKKTKDQNIHAAEAVAGFFMYSMLTPKNYPYGTNRMWNMEGKLVTWEELQKSTKNFDLFGKPWFNADRFGVVQAPWIARAGWGDLDFMVEAYATLFEVTKNPLYLKVAEDFASPFMNYKKIHDKGEDPRRDFCFLVRSDPDKPIQYDQDYFWAHDAEGALYAYLRLAEVEPDAAKAKQYRKLGLRMADLWLQIMKTSLRTEESGWPPFWMYTLDTFLPNKPIAVRPRLSAWLHETEEESRAQYNGSDFFRIDHIPHGLISAYLISHDKKYLNAADEIVQWIHQQKNFDPEHVSLLRVQEPRKGFFAPHNAHPDSPYMRSSLVMTHALLAKAWEKAGNQEKSAQYAQWAVKGMNSLLNHRLQYQGKSYPTYSLEKTYPTYKGKFGNIPVYLNDEIWSDPAYQAASLHNELYGYVYDYLWSSLHILEKLKY